MQLTFESGNDPLQLSSLHVHGVPSEALIQIKTKCSTYELMLIDVSSDGAAVVIRGNQEQELQEPRMAWLAGAITSKGLQPNLCQAGASLQFECIIGTTVREFVSSPVEERGIALLLRADKDPFEMALRMYQERLIHVEVPVFSPTVWEVITDEQGIDPVITMQFVNTLSGSTREVLHEALKNVRKRGVLEEAMRALEFERTLWGNIWLLEPTSRGRHEERVVKKIRTIMEERN